MFPEPSTVSAQLALDTIDQKPTKGIPSWMIHVMEHSVIERLAGVQPGEYRRKPVDTYLAFQRAAGTCLIDQFIPENPLTMEEHGYEGAEKGATTGADQIVLDDMIIDSPEAAVEHLECVVFPRIERNIAGFNEDERVCEIIDGELTQQEAIGPTMLKSGYAFIQFPTFAYSQYGYEYYFMAYALYPDVVERHFSLQADYAALNNRAAARAYVEGGLPPLYRLDFDMADSRGLLVRPKTLDRLWLPHFARSLEPMVKTDVKMIWHCDGNLMDLVPRLLEVGIRGFQGFQYEDGMDYERICAMKTKDGDPLIIIGGASVTRTLPFGKPADVKHEIDWLVAHGPKVGLFLGGSSSIAPGVAWENIQTLVEGLRYYREHGRA
ncbi:MAG: hypothetical protein GX620_09710 [Chloroflexi bacterium]|nr:hypothetical protein [Chloroflexota bacterium]